MRYDLVIIGAGPAGLAAALDAAYLKMKTLVLEAGKAGGALTQSYPWKRVDSCLGLSNMVGSEVAEKMISHVKDEGIVIRENEHVESVERHGGKFLVATGHGRYECGSVIVATGIRGVPRKLGVEGEELEGVDYAVTDPVKFKGKKVLVVGGGDSAVDSALGLLEAGARVWLAHRRDDLRAVDESKEKIRKSQVRILWNTEVSGMVGVKAVESVTLSNNVTGKKTTLPFDSVIICTGSIPVKECIEKLGIKMEGICVPVNKDGMTSMPGIFAAGDIVSDIKRIPQALATGERATYSAYKYLRNPYWK